MSVVQALEEIAYARAGIKLLDFKPVDDRTEITPTMKSRATNLSMSPGV